MDDPTSRVGPELPYLEAFHAVCEEGGFGAAARLLGKSQPAISYQIRRLEKVVGTRLIERGGRRILLTPEGKRLRSLCGSFFDDLARARSEWKGDIRSEPLRLGSASGFGRYVLIPALKAVRRRHEELGIRLELRFDSAEVVLRNLEEGASDAAFVYRRRTSNRLRYRSVYDEELVLIAAPSPEDEVASAGLQAPADMERLPFVTYDEGDYVFGRWFDATFGEQPSSIRSVSHFNELEEVVEWVRRGDGVSIVPRDCVADCVDRGEIVVVPAGTGTPCFNEVFMVMRAGSAPRPELEALAEAMGRIVTQVSA